jgi:hypothetical protein
MKRAVILRDYADSDLGVHRYITEAMGVVPTIEIINFDDASAFEAKVRSLDGPGDLLIGLVYQRQTEIPREWLPSVDRLGLYIHRDNQWRTESLTVQPVCEVDAPCVIQAPYSVRPWFVESVKGIEEQAEPDIDVVWLGSECYRMVHESRMTRGDFLDRFSLAVQGRFHFERHLKVHSVQDYAVLMKRAKIALHIHGLGEHCFRFWESLHLGRCLVAQRFEREKLWADPGEIMPWFSTPEEAADVCASLVTSGDWRRVREEQAKWYNEHHSHARFVEWGKEVVSSIFP